MKPTPVIAVFDVGKTNKKLFLFDEEYNIVFERTARFSEITDEDGYPCENLQSLTRSVREILSEVGKMQQFEIKAVNFSTYGASFVYIDKNGKAVLPLYSYLKPYPEDLLKQFYNNYGGTEKFSVETSSPALGSLNSGLQLYRIKYQKPEIFKKIAYALHLPQYLSYLLTGQAFSDLTSIGCHTGLWDFERNHYHEWVIKEGILGVLAPTYPAEAVLPSVLPATKFKVGIGLHDSSASLIPYLVSFREPFILLSTGTWAISLNPFDESPLTEEELQNDCLFYIQYRDKNVKASRLFSGHDYEQQVNRIAAHFGTDSIKYRDIPYQFKKIKINGRLPDFQSKHVKPFNTVKLDSFSDDEEAYYALVINLVQKQRIATGRVLQNGSIKRIFVDGGFSKNNVFMNLMAMAFPDMEVYAASMAQATALGTALAIHKSWNRKSIPNNLIGLKYYSLDN